MKFNVKNRGKRTVGEILIYEEVGESFWAEGVTSKSFKKELDGLGKVDEINVRINSVGGNVFDGIAIYNQLASHKARVIVDVDGLCASIATVIAMAGDVIRMADNGFFMIHNPNMVAAGEAADFRKAADLLDTARGEILKTYTKRPGTDIKELSNAMDAETWYTSEEAEAAGLVDEITGTVAMAAKLDLSNFHHVPEALTDSTPAGTPNRDAARQKVVSMQSYIKPPRGS